MTTLLEKAKNIILETFVDYGIRLEEREGIDPQTFAPYTMRWHTEPSVRKSNLTIFPKEFFTVSGWMETCHTIHAGPELMWITFESLMYQIGLYTHDDTQYDMGYRMEMPNMKEMREVFQKKVNELHLRVEQQHFKIKEMNHALG